MTTPICNTPKTVLIDCDGVLTDGRLHINHTGEKMFKSFHTRDVRAIRELISMGLEVVIVTADDWPGVFAFAEKVGAEVYVTRDKSELPFVNYYAIGDDAWDFGMLAKAVGAFVPADADLSVKKLKGVTVLQTKGGCGVVAEVLRIIVKSVPKL